MLIFTGADKSLPDRAARRCAAEAATIPWESVSEPKMRKSLKLDFDRLKRDERDLRALGVRLMPKKVKGAISDAVAAQLREMVPSGG